MRIARWMSARTIKFGPWTAYRDSRELVGPTGIKVLEPDVMELLFLLPRDEEGGISREKLYRKLWPRGGMAAGSLARCICQLREALQDDPHARGYVLTYFKRGGPAARFAYLWTSYTVVRSSSASDPDPDLVAMQVPEQLWPMFWLALGAAVCLAVFLWFIRPQ